MTELMGQLPQNRGVDWDAVMPVIEFTFSTHPDPVKARKQNIKKALQTLKPVKRLTGFFGYKYANAPFRCVVTGVDCRNMDYGDLFNQYFRDPATMQPRPFRPWSGVTEGKGRQLNGTYCPQAMQLYHLLQEWMEQEAQEDERGFFLVMLSLSLSLYGGGWLRSAFFPRINSDFVEAKITMPEGGSFSQSELVMQRVLDAAEALKSDWNERPEYQDSPAIGSILGRADENAVEVVVATVSEGVDTEAFALELRADSGALSEAKEIRMDYTIRDPGKPIRLVLASRKVEELEALAADVREALLSYPGVFDVSDSFDSPRDELVLELKPAAETLGITLADVARQVRQAFYGAEAQRIPRGREDVKVMVRYPESERLAIANLNDMYIRTPGGGEVPFEAVAAYRVESGYQKLERLDRLRTLEVEADVEANGPAPRAIVQSIFRDYLPKWQQQYPDLFVNLDGELQEEIEFREATVRLMTLAMMVIYALMAVAFRSYWQPVLILTAVPFGLMGAIFGHLILGWQVSMFSIMGVTACAGVVVNDNLVLIDRINRLREQGEDVLSALLQAGEDRFRPIILTSLTTFVGLLPIMSETSVQAQFLIPMVTSLAFGVLFATGVTLILVPALYLIAEDARSLRLRWFGGSDDPTELPTSTSSP